MIGIVYVGKKPWTLDNVAGSGKSWEGAGDVQEVSENQAKVLLRYPDQWALENPADAELLAGPVTVTVIDPATGEKTEVAESSLSKSFENMTKTELTAFAASISLKLSAALSKAQMINAIEEAQRGPEPIQAGVAP